jgi:hypothetical protein
MMISKFLLAASLLALAGCTGGVTSVPFPTPGQAAGDAAAQQTALSATGLDPATLWENEQLANAYACDAWLIRQADQTGALQTAGQLGSLASGGATLFNPLAGFAGQLFSNALMTLSKSGAMPYSDATAAEIRAAMQAYAQAAPQPATLAEAGLLAEGQLWNCTPPGAAALAKKAIDTAQVTAGPPPTAGFAAFAARGAGFAPPIVRVNGR